MSSHELAEWMGYYTLEPFGEAREDYRAGLIAATVANCAGAGKKGKALQPTDFINIYQQPQTMSLIDRKKKQQSQMAVFKQLAGKT